MTKQETEVIGTAFKGEVVVVTGHFGSGIPQRVLREMVVACCGQARTSLSGKVTLVAVGGKPGCVPPRASTAIEREARARGIPTITEHEFIERLKQDLA